MNNNGTNDIDQDIITIDHDNDDTTEEELKQIQVIHQQKSSSFLFVPFNYIEEYSLNNQQGMRSENKRKRQDLNMMTQMLIDRSVNYQYH